MAYPNNSITLAAARNLFPDENITVLLDENENQIGYIADYQGKVIPMKGLTKLCQHILELRDQYNKTTRLERDKAIIFAAQVTVSNGGTAGWKVLEKNGFPAERVAIKIDRPSGNSAGWIIDPESAALAFKSLPEYREEK